jgi:hypothetical protein
MADNTILNGDVVKVPADLRKVLQAHPKAREAWNSITPIARRDWIVAIVTTKVKETRERRIKKAISMLTAGKRRICCFPGIKWIYREQKESGKVDKQIETIAKKLKLN